MVLFKSKNLKTMKKFFIAATALLLVAGSLQAQTKKENKEGTKGAITEICMRKNNSPVST
jgi:hypothetical protein